MEPLTETVAWLGGAVSVVTLLKAYIEWRERHHQSTWEKRQTTWIETDHGQFTFGTWVDRHIKKTGNRSRK